jgi:exocyst complex component 1
VYSHFQSEHTCRLTYTQNEQIKSVEDTKLTSKKRSGPAQFIKYFPTYVGRVESQLIGATTLEIRQIADASYDKIVQAMFSALKQMAKMGDGEGEDKGQLNYHVILIGECRLFRCSKCTE